MKVMLKIHNLVLPLVKIVVETRSPQIVCFRCFRIAHTVELRPNTSLHCVHYSTPVENRFVLLLALSAWHPGT